mgnify:CR=1 FL=1
MRLKIYRINKTLPLPRYMTEHSSGMDLFASIDTDVIIQPGGYALIPTGIKIEIPTGYEAQIRPRSGLAYKYGVTILNSPGTVDSDYRGEIKVIMINHGREPFKVKKQMRIAQLVITRVVHAEIEEVEMAEELNESNRSEGGFGHTGI